MQIKYSKMLAIMITQNTTVNTNLNNRHPLNKKNMDLHIRDMDSMSIL